MKKSKAKRSEFDAAEIAEFRSFEDARGLVRDAIGYLDHAHLALAARDKKKARHCTARVRECLSEISQRLRGR
jgi:hypothetical protein